MNNITFRAAVLSDLPAIIAMLADDILGKQRENAIYPPAQEYVDAFNAINLDANQLQAVAVLGDKIVGTLQITFVPGLARRGAWRGQIEGGRIGRAHRGVGIGELMFEWAIQTCRSRGCYLVQLTTDNQRPDAHRFYEKLGFVSSHAGYKLML